MSETLTIPPKKSNHKGGLRRVGVEIEFAALSVESAAKAVQRLFGGELSKTDAHRYHIEGTELGDFISELDLQYAHSSDDVPSMLDQDDLARLFGDFRERFRELLGDVSSLVVPCEIVCPPVTVVDLRQIDRLVNALKEEGAKGTDENLLYAFGVQLNPEIAEKSADYITSVLKAYLLSSDWLRKQIEVDVTRRVLPFADRFPIDYILHVTNPDYWPEFSELIDDYLAYNPTRNRELDMLPLFAWVDEARVLTAVQDDRIKKRPTFHYRLPDSQFGDPDWNIIQEWNRWCAVEYLADDRNRLARMAHAFEENHRGLLSEDWGVRAGEWIGAA
jgi:hypothetical protein